MRKKIKSAHVVLMFVLILQIVNIVWWGNAKKGYHIDEMSTFHLANGFGITRYQVTDEVDYENQWHHEPQKYLIDWMTVQEHEKFDFRGVNTINSRDNHPPLFYYGIHALSSFFPNVFSKWFGIIPNIGYYVLSQMFLYLIFSRIARSRWAGIATIIAYGFSAAAIGMTIFIRMYALMILNALAAFYIHMRLIDDQKTGKWIVFAGIVCCLGVLTHYYFLIYQFFMSSFCVCCYGFEKQWKKCALYAASILTGLAGAITYYPWIVTHLLSSSRGVEAVNNFISDQNNISGYIRLMNNRLFAGKGKIVLLLVSSVCVVGVILRLIRVKTGTDKVRINLSVLMGIFTGGSYVILISKVAPYIEDRYIAPIFSLLMGMTVCATYWAISQFFRKERVVAASLSVVFVLMAAQSYVGDHIPYLYPQFEHDQRIVHKYREYPAVVVHKNNWDDMVIQFDLMQYSKFYSTSLAKIDTLGEVFAECEGRAILYLRKNNETNENLKRIEESFGMKTEMLFNASGGRFVVYACNSNLRMDIE